MGRFYFLVMEGEMSIKTKNRVIPFHCAYDELWPLEKVIPNPRNPNTHSDAQIGVLSKIIDAQGWRAAITVSKRSGFIVRGHARLLAAMALDTSEVPVDLQDYENEAAEWADLISDNRIAELAVVDKPLMNDILEELKLTDLDLDLTGYDSDAVAELMTELLEDKVGNIDDDRIPEATESICKRGDLWKLGNHRLLCGDATVITDVERLMAGEKADMVFTDPPYGIGYTRHIPDAKFEAIENDDKLLTEWLDLIPPNVPIYVSTRWDVYPQWFRAISQRVKVRNLIVWDKGGGGLGDTKTTYAPSHEFIVYATSTPLDLQGARGSDIWDIGKDADYKHPTQKPVALAEKAISNHRAKSVLDPFGGSGSTLIACEKLARRCYMMEIDEHYCDVIIKRWEEFSGDRAIREA